MVVLNCLLVALGISSCASEIVPFITKCKQSDTPCITKSSQDAVKAFTAGIPKYGVRNMMPALLDDVDVSDKQLKFIVQNIKIYGQDSCKISDMRIEEEKIKGDLECDMRIIGDYNIDGELLKKTAKGKGNFSLVMNRVLFHGESDIVKVLGADRSMHWKSPHWIHRFQLQESPTFMMENLNLDGVLQKELSSEVVLQVQGLMLPPIVQQLVDQTLGNINNFFKAVPLSDLTLD